MMTDDLSFTLEDNRYRQLGLNYWFRRALFDAAWFGSPTVHRARAAVLADW